MVTYVIFSSRLKSGFRTMINKFGLSISPWMVPLLIFMGGVVPKWFPTNDVVELVYMLPTSSIASRG